MSTAKTPHTAPIAPEQDDLTRLYHGTHPQWRTMIEKMGLLPGGGLGEEGMLGTYEDGTPVEAGVFLTPDPEEASDYGRLLVTVDISGMDYLRLDGPDGFHYVIIDSAGVAPDRIHDITER